MRARSASGTGRAFATKAIIDKKPYSFLLYLLYAIMTNRVNILVHIKFALLSAIQQAITPGVEYTGFA